LWPRYWMLGFRAFLHRRRYDAIIAYQGVAGLFMGMFYRFWPFGRKPLILVAFIYKKRKNRIVQALRDGFTRFTLAAADRVICYSSREASDYAAYFRLKRNPFTFLPFGTDTPKLDRIPDIPDGGYVFTAGSSNRDYRTLVEALRDCDMPVVLFAKRYNLAGIDPPSRFDVHYDVFGDPYYRALRAARIVIVPLDDPELSSGQMVLLESMYFGKPVVITRGWGNTDYIRDGENAVCVAPHDPRAMADAVHRLLADPALAGRIGAEAKKTIVERFDVGRFAGEMAGLVRALASAKAAS
jgi:glycosyltransferase involved in cell wall biosynthesis